MSTIPFNAQTKEEALSQYTQLSHSPNPNDKLLALGGLIRFIQNADHSFLLLCAKATDYQFLDRLIRNGMSIPKEGVDVVDVKLHEEGQGDVGQLSQLGCAVVGVFAKMEEMRGQKEILNRIPSLISVLERQYFRMMLLKTDSRNDHEVTDTVDTLQSLATIQRGADLVLVPSSVSILLKFVESGTNHLNDVLALLHTALEHASPSVDALPVLKPLSQLFSTTKSPVVVNELSAFFTSQFASTPPPKSLHLSLYRGLKNLTMSSLDETARTNTVILLSLLLIQIGPTFLFSPPSTELNAKQMALLTIRLASAGCQTGFSRLETSSPQLDKQQLIAEMDILHVTTAWLLSSEDDTLKIGSEFLTPDDILKVQETLSSAIREVSVYLRGKYDDLRSSEQVTSFEEVIDPVVRTAVKFVGGWLGEGGSGQDEESLGLLEVLLALCSTGDVDITTWSMRGIKGIILYTDNGATELLVSKDQLLKLLRVVAEMREQSARVGSQRNTG